MSVQTRTSIDEAAWDAMVERHPAGSVYHTTAWAHVVKDAFGAKLFWLTREESGGGIAEGLPVAVVHSRIFGKKLSAFPCAQYCDPLVSSEADLRELAEALRILKGRTGAVTAEIRIRRPPLDDKSAPAEWAYCTHNVDLSRPESAIFKSFHKSCIQRPLSGQKQSALTIRCGRAEQDVRDFYKLYAGMRKSKGLIPVPLRFFLALQRRFMTGDGGEILQAVHEGRIVSSILVLYHSRTAIYENGADLSDAKGLHPNQRLLWEAMKRSKARGCAVFNLGRTGSDNPGLMRYKQRWGSELVPLAHLSPDGQVQEPRGSLRSRALGKIMKTTVRLLPGSVCVLIGDLVYGHTI